MLVTLKHSPPVLEHGNVVVVFLLTPQPTLREGQKLEARAFGAGARPTSGPLVGQ